MDVLRVIWTSLSPETVISVVIGGIVSIAATWIFSWLYFVRAGEQLRAETAKLRRVTPFIFQELKHPGTVEVKQDERGRLVFALKFPAGPGHVVVDSSEAVVLTRSKPGS